MNRFVLLAALAFLGGLFWWSSNWLDRRPAELPPPENPDTAELSGLEARFCDIVEIHRQAFTYEADGPSSSRDARQAEIVRARRDLLAGLFATRADSLDPPGDAAGHRPLKGGLISGWRGQLSAVSPALDARSLTFVVTLPCDVRLTAVRNYLPGSSAYKTLQALRNGGPVAFSGSFVEPEQPRNAIADKSVTVTGSMRAPNYYFIFTRLEPYPEVSRR